MPYTIITRAQVTPKYVERSGESRLNPIPQLVNPQSFTRLIFSPLQATPHLIYEQAIVELWEDLDGTATWADIKAQTSIIAHLQSIVKTEAKLEIEKKWPLWAQNNCALGIYSSATINQCKTDIAAVITASNTAEDLISNAVSMDAALAVKAVWPTL